MISPAQNGVLVIVSDYNSNSSCKPFHQPVCIPTVCVHIHYTDTHAHRETHTHNKINVFEVNCG